MTLRERIEALEATQERILVELRVYRRWPQRADAGSCGTLLEYLQDHFDEESWTAAAVIEGTMENPLLMGAVKRCLGWKPTVYRLSLLLTRCLNRAVGPYRLQCIADHSRDGRVFRVTGPVTRSQNHRAMVKAEMEDAYE
jgi:hypothetical protein